MNDEERKKALDEAERKAEALLPGIRARNRKGVEQSPEEPDHLRSGSPDHVGIRRAIREQNDEK
ncbi:MAG: hypothetical protein LAT63_10000 [Marinobacter sp.]|nr:hypothetical protein [Marinobacter sp.]